MFKSLKSGLAKVFANQKIDQNTIQDFEDLLITSDVDVETSELITTKLGNEKFSDAPSLEEIQSSLIKSVPNLSAHSFNCSAAAALKVSAATNRTFLFSC